MFAIAMLMAPSEAVLIDRTAGTPVGDMVNGGGLAAAFDGNYAQAFGGGAAYTAPASSYFIGKDWGAGVLKTCAGFKIHASTNEGFFTNGGATLTFTLKGSNSTPSLGSGTSLGSTTGPDTNNQVVSLLTGVNTSTSYRYHWVEVAGGTSDGNISELELYEEY